MNTKELKELYYNPEFGYMGKDKFIQKLQDNKIPYDEDLINNFFENQQIHQVYKKPIVREYLTITAPPRTFQVDVMNIEDYFKFNKGFRKLLVFVDILTNKAFVYPMKGNTKEDILNAFQEFKDDVGFIFGIQGDDEFSKKYFDEEMKKNDIKLHTDVAKDDHIIKGDKLAIVDRFIRTFRGLLQRYMYDRETYNWFSIYKSLLDNFNDTPIRNNFNLTPNQMFNDIIAQQRRRLLDEAYNDNVMENRELHIGDKVRIINLDKKPFGKESKNFTDELYTINDVIGNKYEVIDDEGVIKQRKFKYYEIVKVPLDTKNTIKKVNKKQETFMKNLEKAKQVRKDNDILDDKNIENYVKLVEKEHKQKNIDRPQTRSFVKENKQGYNLRKRN